MSGLLQDLRITIRGLRQKAEFALLAILVGLPLFEGHDVECRTVVDVSGQRLPSPISAFVNEISNLAGLPGGFRIALIIAEHA